jgi:nitric oxide reductase large subunit
MLLLISAIKLIAEIALLALAGQWLLGLLAGQKRDKNIFYQILQQVGRPFVQVARMVTPRKVLLLAFLWIGITLFKVSHCLKIGVQLCQ